MSGDVVPLDAAGALWQFAASNAHDFLRGNYKPSLREWVRFLHYHRSICKWRLVVYFDGRENPDKSFETQRRQVTAANAQSDGNLRGQIRNTPLYIAHAFAACRFLDIECYVSAYEADPQVSYHALVRSLTPMTGDSDILAYGPTDDDWEWMGEDSKQLEQILLVGKYRTEWYRIIDLHSNVATGEYPLFDLYKDHGRLIFQLYAGCSGCDFTQHRSGIPGIGYKRFLELVVQAEPPLSAESLGITIWQHDSRHAIAAGLQSSVDVVNHLQCIVDIYTRGQLYNNKSCTIDMSGTVRLQANAKSNQHMKGLINPRTLQEFEQSVLNEMKCCNYSQLLHQSAVDTSTIRGIKLPNNKTPEQCTVVQLRDMILARGGTVTMNKPELVAKVKQYIFLEKQVDKNYVDRNPNPNGRFYSTIETSSTRSVGAILTELNQKLSNCADATDDHALVNLAHSFLNQGLFDDKYDNISRCAPELPESLIYKTFAHIGSSIKQKNIGNALQRCWYDNDTLYHGIAFVPDSDKVVIMSKCHASMARDEKTRKQTDEGEMPKKKEYLLLMEMRYAKTNMIENGHDLGYFVELTRSYCTACVAGQGLCRHRGERLWYQYHHWTDERLGIDRPPTLDVCGWATGGKALSCDVRQKIHEQQSVKHTKTIADQIAKTNRGVKRDCTEGNSCDYQLYLSDKKQKHKTGRFTNERVKKLFKLLREQSNE